MPKIGRRAFKLISSTQEEADEKVMTISFKQPIDLANPDGIKMTHNVRHFSSAFIENLLKIRATISSGNLR